MDRTKKIQLLKDIASGNIRIEQLKKQKPYKFERIEKTDTYKNLESGEVMTLKEINKLTANSMRIDYVDGDTPFIIQALVGCL